MGRLTRRPFPLVIGPVLSLALVSCAVEGEERIPVGDVAPDPCEDPALSLDDGIQTGTELLALFNCVNANGQFDAFVPVMDAMATEVISDGETTILDMWLNIIEDSLSSESGASASVSPTDLADVLDQVLSLLDEEWLDDGIDIMGRFMDSDAVEPGLAVANRLGAALVALQYDEEGLPSDAYDAYFDTIVDLMCPDLEDYGQCIGDMQQIYRASTDIYAAYSDEELLSAGEDMTRLISGLFAAANGDTYTNESLDESLGEGIERIAETDFLLNTLNVYLPALYGDDPSTPELEGYESFNENESALFALLDLMGDPDFAVAMNDMMMNVGPLMTDYYTYTWFVSGNGEPAHSGDCQVGESGVFADDEPAYYGLDQILRFLKSADVSYEDAPDPSCSDVIDLIYLSAENLYAELSGSTNIATITLELFSQLSAEEVQVVVNDLAGAFPASLFDEFNDWCGTTIVADDFEALQKAVDITPVIQPSLDLLRAVTRAGQMDALKDLLVDLYDTHMLCEAQPWLAAVMTDDGPLVSDPESVEPSPFMPGGAYHESMTIPMLRMLVSLRGDRANTLIPPLNEALSTSGRDIGDMLAGIGAMAYDAEVDAAYGEDPSLFHIVEIMAGLRSYDTNYTGLQDQATLLVDQRALVTGLLETLANPEVIDSLGDAYPRGGQSAIQFTADFLNEGQLTELLRMLQSVLVELDASGEDAASGS